MAKHSTATGADLHDPKGKYPNWLELDPIDTAYLIKDTSGNNYLVIKASAGSEVIELSNAGTNAEVQILGTGGAEIVGPVTLPKQAADPSNEATKGKLYTKDPGDGETELFYIDASGNAVQITDGGAVNGGGGGGGSALTVENKTTSFTAAVDYFYTIDSSAGDVTATLPTVSGNSGKTIDICHKITGNFVIIDGNGAETVNGAAQITMTGQTPRSNITLVCTGSEWLIR